jgi:hypothetical protein
MNNNWNVILILEFVFHKSFKIETEVSMIYMMSYHIVRVLAVFGVRCMKFFLNMISSISNRLWKTLYHGPFDNTNGKNYTFFLLIWCNKTVTCWYIASDAKEMKKYQSLLDHFTDFETNNCFLLGKYCLKYNSFTMYSSNNQFLNLHSG